MRTSLPAALVVVFGAACAGKPGPRPAGSATAASAVTPGSVLEADAPADWRPAIERGNTAIQALGQQLRERLLSALQTGGAGHAVGVCRDEAQGITAQVAQAHGLKLGRTSLALRNPVNAAPAWLAPHLQEVWGQPAEQVAARVFELETAIGIARPIAMGSACVKCHGAPDRIEPQVQAVLAEAYPEDRATGFEPGALRGLFWAEVPKIDPLGPPGSLPSGPSP